MCELRELGSLQKMWHGMRAESEGHRVNQRRWLGKNPRDHDAELRKPGTKEEKFPNKHLPCRKFFRAAEALDVASGLKEACGWGAREHPFQHSGCEHALTSRNDSYILKDVWIGTNYMLSRRMDQGNERSLHGLCIFGDRTHGHGKFPVACSGCVEQKLGDVVRQAVYECVNVHAMVVRGELSR